MMKLVKPVNMVYSRDTPTNANPHKILHIHPINKTGVSINCATATSRPRQQAAIF